MGDRMTRDPYDHGYLYGKRMGHGNMLQLLIAGVAVLLILYNVAAAWGVIGTEITVISSDTNARGDVLVTVTYHDGRTEVVATNKRTSGKVGAKGSRNKISCWQMPWDEHKQCSFGGGWF